MLRFARSSISSRLSLLLLIVLLCGVPAQRTAGDCGPGGPLLYTYNFIDPAIAGFRTSLAQYFLRFSAIYEDYFQPAAAIQVENNLQEWRQRVCERATIPDLQYVIYQSSINELENLRMAIATAKQPMQALSGAFYDNSFARHLARYRCRETVDYLIFAKRCEPLVTVENPWASRPPSRGEMNNLIEEGRRQFYATESHYIRLRYAYQIIRLAHYLKEHQRVLDLYAELMPKIDNDPSIIDWWIEGHRAGALLALGDNVKASYLYSRIFEECPSKRESAYRSFRITSDDEWQQLMLLCRNDHEKAMIYVLRAQAEDARLIEEMRNIYALEPDNDALELLLLREMQRLERDLLGLEFNPRSRENRRDFGVPRPGAGQRVIDLQTFVRQVLEEGNVQRIELWTLAQGFLEMLAGDYYYAKKTFERADELIENDTLREQLAAFDLVLDILSLGQIDADTERQYYRLRTNSDLFQRYPDFDKMMRDKFRVVYEQTGQDGKAFLLQYRLDQLKPNLQLNIIDDLLELTRSENRTRLEQQIITKRDGGTIENDLLDMKATYYLSQQQLEAAFEVFRQIPRPQWDNYGQYNPFIQRLNDCVHCPLPDTAMLYNKGALMEEIMDLEYRARSEINPDQQAVLFFRLGLAYYNMSYFSYGWKIADYFRSGTSARRAFRDKGETVFGYPGFPFGNREVFNTVRARDYFDRARLLARTPELAARATFWAAKCERNEFYTSAPVRTNQYFELLAENYRDTEFYQRVIAECKTFAAYVAR